MKSIIQLRINRYRKIISIKSIIIWGILSISQMGQSQSCDNFNPNNFQHTTNFWDWTNLDANNWVAYYINATGGSNINPPFKSIPSGIAQPNVNFLYPPGVPVDKIDMYPQDGWELIIRNFGINSVSTPDRVNNPGFVLYNRFRSILRFFIYASPNPQLGSTSTMMKVSMPQSSNKIPAYFNNITSISNALDTITKTIPETSNPNLYYRWQNNWLIIDMPVSYDPCVCTQPYDNSLNAHYMQYEYAEVTTTTSVGKMTENSTKSDDLIKNGDYSTYIDVNTNPLIAGVTKTVSFFNQAYTAGNAGKKQFTGFSTEFQSAANGVWDFIRPQLREDNLPKDIVWPQAFKSLFDALPYAGMAFGIYNFIANGGNRSLDYSKYYSGFATPREYGFTATATTLSSSTVYNFYTPGSQFNRASANHGEKPIYDYALGNFQLLETPELEMQVYMDTINIQSQMAHHVADNALSPRIIQYRLKNPLKYVVNPASELSIKSFDVALEYRIKRNSNFFRYIDTFHTAKTRALNITKGTYEDFFQPMLGPVFIKQSDDPLYSKRLAKSGVYIANWPTKWTDTAVDIFQNVSGQPIVSKGYTKEHLFNATFATQWFNPVLYKEYSFLIGDMPTQLNTGQNIGSGSNIWQPINVAGTKGLVFKMDPSNLDVKLKVRAILKRNDADATAGTEDIVVVQTYDVKKPSISYATAQQNFKSYAFNNYSPSWSSGRRPGKDFYIHSLNNGSPVFPINDAITYPDTIWMNSPFTATKDTIIYATSAIFVNAAINTSNFKVEFRSLYVEYGDNYVGSVTGTGVISDNISGKRPGSEPTLQPTNWTDILNFHCKNKSKYDPVFNKMVIKPNYSTSSAPRMAFQLHPNPAKDFTRIVIDQPVSDKAKVEVYDMLGRAVYMKNYEDLEKVNAAMELPTSALNSGIYIVKIWHGELEQSLKLEIQK